MGFTIDGLDDVGGEVEGLKKFRKKIQKSVKKVARKAAPVVGLAANLIPGVGQVASAAILTAAAADKKRQAQKKARRAGEAFAAEEAEMMQAGGQGGVRPSQGQTRVELREPDGIEVPGVPGAAMLQTMTGGGSAGPAIAPMAAGPNMRTMLMVGAAGVAALFLLRK